MPVRRSGAAALVAVCALALPGRTRAQAESLGSPVLTNYDPGQYKAHAQNWVAVQDRRGVLYFGNSVGILEFDGRRWQLIPTRDGAIVRALTIGPDGTVYYGSVGDIGYLTASPEGKVTSVSLRDAIPEADRTFNDVWQALSTSRGIYFLTRERVFRFADGEVRPIPARITSSQACVLDDDLFLVDPERGICLVRGDEVVPVPALAGLVGGRRLVLAPFGPRQLLVARSAGDVSRVDLGPFWVEATRSYDFSRPVPEGVVTRVPTELDEILPETEAFLYKLYPLDGETFAVCTIRAGVFVIDRSGKVVRVVNTQRGLIDNTVSGVFVDRAGDLWVTSNSGITHVALSSPQSWFGARDGIQGVSISVARSRGRFFVGTYQNVFVQRPYRFGGKDDRQVFEPLENGPSEVWQFVERGGDLLVASGQGVFRIVGEKAVLVPEARRAAYSLGVTRRFPDTSSSGSSAV